MTGDRLTMTVEEAGAVLGISRSLAYELVRRGELPSLRLGRRVVVPARALEALVDNPIGSRLVDPCHSVAQNIRSPRTNPLWVKRVGGGVWGRGEGTASCRGRSVWVGPGLCRRTGRQGCRIGHAGVGVVPGCPPGPAVSASGAGGVGNEVAVDRIGYVTLEGPQRFFVGSAFGDVSIDVGASSEPGWRSWQMTAMCRAWLRLRLPRWESRWTVRPPEEKSTGAVPL